MTVFHNRRTDSYDELSGDFNDSNIITGISGHNSQYSGGMIPLRNDSTEQYPLDQTASVVNMR